jgi:hypothetical protein
MIGIFRGSIPGSSVSGITSATVVQAAFFTVTSVLIVICVAVFRPHSVAKGSPSNELGDFFPRTRPRSRSRSWSSSRFSGFCGVV